MSEEFTPRYVPMRYDIHRRQVEGPRKRLQLRPWPMKPGRAQHHGVK